MGKLEDDLVAAVGKVEDPVLFEPLAELGVLREVKTSWRDRLKVVLALPGDPYPALDELRRRVRAALPGGTEPEIVVEAMDEAETAELGQRLKQLAGVAPSGADQGQGGDEARGVNPFLARRSSTRVLAIASGKGGVGKSSVTVNLSVALARRGLSVGLVDADIYGFSVPRMLGIDRPPMVLGRTLVPPVAHGVRVISMAFFVDEERGVAWRGPMLHRAIEQFLVDVYWSRLDVLVVDMPPGTGDVALSLGQHLPSAELYVVTTPQPAAQRVAQRSAALGRQLRLPVRGVIENMSFFEAPDGTRYEIFGAGGGAQLAETLGVPLLAQIPLELAVREGADEGRPAVEVAPDGPVARAFDDLARQVAELGPVRVYRKELSVS
jgi:ATP-binding protein involved in chromosome partitioning